MHCAPDKRKKFPSLYTKYFIQLIFSNNSQFGKKHIVILLNIIILLKIKISLLRFCITVKTY